MQFSFYFNNKNSFLVTVFLICFVRQQVMQFHDVGVCNNVLQV